MAMSRISVVQRALFGLGLLCCVAACHVDLNDPGTEPLAAQLYYPSSLLVDPELPYLYIANANSDVRFGGGTLMVADLARFSCAVEQTRAVIDGKPDVDAARCPQAKDDSSICVVDYFDPQVINCDETRFILANSTVKIGNFAGQMVLQRRDNGLRRLFVGVRGDPSVTWLDIDPARLHSGKRALNCYDPATLARLDAQPDFDPTTDRPSPVLCDVSHLIQNYICAGQPNCTLGLNLLPVEPFGLALDQGTLPDGSPYANLLISHLAGGQVTLLDVQAGPVVQYVSSAFFAPDSAMRRGAFSLTPQYPGRHDSLWYMTSTVQPVVSTFKLTDIGTLAASTSFTTNGLFSTGLDTRKLVFEPGGQRAFLAQGNPPVAMVIDTSIRTDGPAPDTNANRVVDVVNICQSPSDLLLRPDERGRPRLYTPCFLTGQVAITDPDRPELLDFISVGRGPSIMAFHTDTTLNPKERAYVANFLESTVSVIDFDASSPTARRMVARLGIPVPPPAQ